MADDSDAHGGASSSGAKRKKTPLLLIIGVVGILVLGGGGFFAYTKLVTHKAAIPEHAATEEAPGKSAGAIHSLDTFIVNLVDPKGKRYLKVKMELEVDSPKVSERLKQLDAKLKDAVIMLLTSLTFEDVMTPEGKIRIRDELMDRFNQLLKPDRITNIYFTEFVVQ